MRQSQPRKLSVGVSLRNPSMWPATLRNTSWATSATSGSASPLRRHQRATSGAYRVRQSRHAASSRARSRASSERDVGTSSRPRALGCPVGPTGDDRTRGPFRFRCPSLWIRIGSSYSVGWHGGKGLVMATEDWVPTDDDLLAFDRGLLPEAEADAVLRWLESHPEAETRIQRLTGDRPDAVAAALRKPAPSGDALDRASGLASDIIGRVLREQPAGPVGNSSTRTLHVMPATVREYRLVQPLGQGGMGRVYRARHARLQRDVAIKFLPAELAADPWYRARFEREMAVIGPLDHPNLVRAHDAGLEDGQLFLAMELLEGTDLSRLLAARGPLPVADACELARQAALGLQYAHEPGAVHRDVKPGNLFLTAAGVVKVIDLGLARVQDLPPGGSKISTGRCIMGTPEYLAPEQWDNTAVDHRADIYALGCVLFELLTGRTPYGELAKGRLSALMLAHQTEPPPPLAERCPGAPAALP